MEKTQVIVNKVRLEEFIITVENITMTKVNEYKYLGHIITNYDKMQNELKATIQAGWVAFSKLKSILKVRNIPMNLKSKVCEQCVLSAMTYP